MINKLYKVAACTFVTLPNTLLYMTFNYITKIRIQYTFSKNCAPTYECFVRECYDQKCGAQSGLLVYKI